MRLVFTGSINKADADSPAPHQRCQQRRRHKSTHTHPENVNRFRDCDLQSQTLLLSAHTLSRPAKNYRYNHINDLEHAVRVETDQVVP